MKYDRANAIDYARRFWDRPCDDGVFWLSNDVVNVERKRRELHALAGDGWEPRFVADGSGGEKAVFQRTVSGGTTEEKLIQPWAGLADCAHFLSKCLQAGGIDISERGVPTLVRHLQDRNDTKTLGEKVTQDHGQRIVDSGIFKEGDMIGYFNVDPQGDYGGAKEYSHSTMYTGKLDPKDDGRVTCHTKSRFKGLSPHPDKWWLEADSYLYTFIHFSSDDLPIPQPSPLEGWWEIKYSGRTEYYKIEKDGRAHYTLQAPKPRATHIRSDGSAYWFQQSKTIIFTWRKTGTVEVWSPGIGGDFKIMVNETQPGTATKLF